MKTFLALLILALPASGATYYVATTGNDSNPGSSVSPWLTVAKACLSVVSGDVVQIANGTYNEAPPNMLIAGTSISPITFTATNPRLAIMKGFRINAPYITLDGIKFSKFSDVGTTNAACVRIERVGSGSVVNNCEFTDYPYVKAHDFTFGVPGGVQDITSNSSDFVAAGFVTGSKVYLGASGATVGGNPLFYNNHDIIGVAGTVTQHTMTLASPVMVADAGTNYWAFIRAGSGNVGFPAVQIFSSSGQPPPTGIVISNNRVSNWPASAFVITGDNHRVENNYLTNLLSFRFLSFEGSNHVIRRNVIKDCLNVLHYTPTEAATVTHPAGSGWYDYVASMIFGLAPAGAHQHVLVENNWFENIENQIGSVSDENPLAFDIVYNRNVFVGCTLSFSGGRDGMQWTNNTFFRCMVGSEVPAPHPLTIGGRDTPHTGYVLRGNLFIANNNPSNASHNNHGFYSIGGAGATSPSLSLDMVASEEVNGFHSKTAFTEAGGINGGDPMFLQPLDPIGPDGIAFTADDGLQVLSNSPAAATGGGALGIYTPETGAPVAHFRVTNPNGWFELPPQSYDPAWNAQLPTQRTNVARPYTNPPKVGNAPVSVTFNGTGSLNAANYRWDFGDGTAIVSGVSSTVVHTFTVAGDYTVKLSVTGTGGDCHSFYNAYRVTSP